MTDSNQEPETDPMEEWDEDLFEIGYGDDFIPLDNVVSVIADPIRDLVARFESHESDTGEGDGLARAPWREILGKDHPSLSMVEALSQGPNPCFDVADFFEAIGIEVTREFWDSDMPGHNGFHRQAYLSERGAEGIGRDLGAVVELVDDWRFRTGVMQEEVERLRASVARIASEAKQAEEQATRLAIARSMARGRLDRAREEVEAASAELARREMGRRADEIIAFAESPEGRFHRDGLILVDPEGRIWRIHGSVNAHHHRHLTDELVAAIRGLGRDVIDVVESFDGPPPPNLAHPRFGRTYEGWTVDTSVLRVEDRDDLDPAAVRAAYQAWASAD